MKDKDNYAGSINRMTNAEIKKTIEGMTEYMKKVQDDDIVKKALESLIEYLREQREIKNLFAQQGVDVDGLNDEEYRKLVDKCFPYMHVGCPGLVCPDCGSQQLWIMERDKQQWYWFFKVDIFRCMKCEKVSEFYYDDGRYETAHDHAIHEEDVRDWSLERGGLVKEDFEEMDLSQDDLKDMGVSEGDLEDMGLSLSDFPKSRGTDNLDR